VRDNSARYSAGVEHAIANQVDALWRMIASSRCFRVNRILAIIGVPCRAFPFPCRLISSPTELLLHVKEPQ
jgi:hypothetical protein